MARFCPRCPVAGHDGPAGLLRNATGHRSRILGGRDIVRHAPDSGAVRAADRLLHDLVSGLLVCLFDG